MKLTRIPSRYGGRVPTWKPKWWIVRLKGHAVTRFESVTLYNFAIGPLWVAIVTETARDE